MIHITVPTPNPNPDYKPPINCVNHDYIPPASMHAQTNAEWLESMPDEEFVNLLDAVKYEEVRRQRLGRDLQHSHLLTWFKEKHK